MLETTCPGCRLTIKAPYALADHTVQCPKCAASVRIPSAFLEEVPTPQETRPPAVVPLSIGWENGVKTLAVPNDALPADRTPTSAASSGNPAPKVADGGYNLKEFLVIGGILGGAAALLLIALLLWPSSTPKPTPQVPALAQPVPVQPPITEVAITPPATAAAVAVEPAALTALPAAPTALPAAPEPVPAAAPATVVAAPQQELLPDPAPEPTSYPVFVSESITIVTLRLADRIAYAPGLASEQFRPGFVGVRPEGLRCQKCGRPSGPGTLRCPVCGQPLTGPTVRSDQPMTPAFREPPRPSLAEMLASARSMQVDFVQFVKDPARSYDGTGFPRQNQAASLPDQTVPMRCLIMRLTPPAAITDLADLSIDLPMTAAQVAAGGALSTTKRIQPMLFGLKTGKSQAGVDIATADLLFLKTLPQEASTQISAVLWLVPSDLGFARFRGLGSANALTIANALDESEIKELAGAVRKSAESLRKDRETRAEEEKARRAAQAERDKEQRRLYEERRSLDEARQAKLRSEEQAAASATRVALEKAQLESRIASEKAELEKKLASDKAQQESLALRNALKAKQPTVTVRALVVSDAATGALVGSTLDVIVICPPHQAPRANPNDGCIFADPQVGPQMRRSMSEAGRLVNLRRAGAAWLPLECSFSDKYVAKDGGSAGTAFALGMLSLIDGFTVDPAFTVTGDIVVNGTVQPVGGVDAKLRAARNARCRIAAIPSENATALADLALQGEEDLCTMIQIFKVRDIDEVVALARLDRSGSVAEACAGFAALAPRFAGGVATALKDTVVIGDLRRISALAPNHLSAKHLLDRAAGTLPKTLSLTSTWKKLDEINAQIVLSAINRLEQRVSDVADNPMHGLLAQFESLHRIADPSLWKVISATEDWMKTLVAKVDLQCRFNADPALANRALEKDRLENFQKTLNNKAAKVRESYLALGRDVQFLERIR